MSERFSNELLRSLRNDLPIGWIIDTLDLPVKISEGYVRFLCPLCREFDTATNPRTNLARCFRCRENFNPIDMVMIVKRVNFTGAVHFLLPHRRLFPGSPSEEKPPTEKK